MMLDKRPCVVEPDSGRAAWADPEAEQIGHLNPVHVPTIPPRSECSKFGNGQITPLGTGNSTKQPFHQHNGASLRRRPDLYLA
jgi:hypothetical protein